MEIEACKNCGGSSAPGSKRCTYCGVFFETPVPAQAQNMAEALQNVTDAMFGFKGIDHKIDAENHRLLRQVEAFKQGRDALRPHDGITWLILLGMGGFLLGFLMLAVR